MTLFTRKKSQFFLYFIVLFLFYPPLLHARQIQVPADYPTIQNAIDAAASGDTIALSDGTYKENITINKPLTLRSASFNSELAIIKAKSPVKPVIAVLSTKEVNITNLTIQGSTFKPGIYAEKCLQCRFVSNYLQENKIGIFLDKSNNCYISQNLSTRNAVGLKLDHSSSNTLEANNIDWNTDKGAFFVYSNKNIYIDNTSNNNTWNGITLLGSHSNVIKDNISVSNSFAIVISDDSLNNEVSGNREMKRIHYLLPIAIAYVGLMLYFLEKRFFRWYLREKD